MRTENGELIFELILKEAWKYQFLTYPNPAVGAVLIVKNKVFISAHKKAGMPHAEVNVIYEAYKHFFKASDLTTSTDIHNFLYQNHNNFFNEATIYVTLEPCSECSKNVIASGIKRIVYEKSYEYTNSKIVSDFIKANGVLIEQIS